MVRRVTGYLMPVTLLVASCAVLTVDVDVYKGPLANEEEVQVQQMLSLATAAKPMLVELRDRLEWGARMEKCRERAIQEGWYSDAFVADLRVREPGDPPRVDLTGDLPAGSPQSFRIPGAMRVNAILSLYEDVGNEAEELLARYRGLVAALRDHLPKVKAGPGSQDLRADQAAYVAFALRRETTGDRADKVEEIVGGFLLPTRDYRQVKPLLGLLKDEGRFPEDVRAAAERAADKKMSTNEAFRFLERDDVAERIGLLVYPGRSERVAEERAWFVGRIQEIARLYLNTRGSLDELLVTGLQLLLLNDRQDFSDSDRIALAEATVELIDPLFLTWVAHSPTASAPLRRELSSFLLETLKDQARDQEWNREDFELVRARMSKALADKPVILSRLLLDANSAARSSLEGGERCVGRGNITAVTRELWDRIADDGRRQFGITVTPWVRASQGGEFSVDMLDSLESLRVASALGLGGGRLAEGLETMIEAHLEAQKARDGSRPTQEERETALEDEKRQLDALVDALVRFSQKVLFLANNDGLLNPPPPPALVPGVLYVVWHHLLGGTMVEKGIVQNVPWMERSGISVPEAQRNYISVLQAVGSSILVQADEYRHRSRDEQFSLDVERQGVSRLFTTSYGQYLEKVIEALEDEEVALEAKAKAAKEKAEEAGKALAKLLVEKGPNDKAVADLTCIRDTLVVIVEEKASPCKLAEEAKQRLDGIERQLCEAGKATEEFQSELEKLLQLASSGKKELDPKRESLTTSSDKARKELDVLAEDVETEVFDELRKAIKHARKGERKTLAVFKDDELAKRAAKQVDALHTGSDRAVFEVLAKKLESLEERASAASDALGELPKAADDDGWIAELKKWQSKQAKALDPVSGCPPPSALSNEPTELVERIRKTCEALAKDLKEAKVKAAAAEKEEVRIAAATKEATRIKLKAEGEKLAAENQRSGVATTGKVVTAHLGDLDAAARAESPTGARRRLLAELEKRESKIAHAVVDARAFAIPTLDQDTLAKAKRPAEVLDLLISALHHQYIESVLAGDDDTPRSRRLAKARKLAIARRAELVRIRPAGAYLRTSYPSAALQDDPGLAWSNRLEQSGLRSLPLLGSLWRFLVPDPFPEAEIQAGIDKQFWQNINRVRLTGTGNANYVVAKDDIGNWYVKSYENNMDKVLSSAQSLGALAIGLDEDLGIFSKLAKKDGTESADAPDTTVSERVSDHHKAEYAKVVSNERKRVGDELNGDSYAESIEEPLATLTTVASEKAEWKADITAGSTTLTKARTTVTAKVDDSDDDSTNDDELSLLIGGLELVLSFHDELDAKLANRVRDARKVADEATAKKNSAQAEVDAAAKAVSEKRNAEAEARTAWDDARDDADDDSADEKDARAKFDAAVESLQKEQEKEVEAGDALAKAATAAEERAAALRRQENARAKAAKLGRDFLGGSASTLGDAAKKYQDVLSLLMEGLEASREE